MPPQSPSLSPEPPEVTPEQPAVPDNMATNPAAEPSVPPAQADAAGAATPISQETPNALQPQPTTVKPPTGKRRLTKFVVAVLVVAALILVAYILGSHHKAEAPAATTTNTVMSSITVPKDATVTADCANNRGKQYVVPKDIPKGPIYDVYQGKVVAIEYLVGQTDLKQNSAAFANLGVPNIAYNHLTILPMDPHAGENQEHFHAIMYLISETEASKIVCSAASQDNMSMTGSM